MAQSIRSPELSRESQHFKRNDSYPSFNMCEGIFYKMLAEGKET